MKSLISMEAVSACRGNSKIIDCFSLKIEPGEVVALLGPSGSGKSTLLRIILGFLAPDNGVVRIRDNEVSRDGRICVPPEERNLAVVFQDLALWPHLSIQGNLEFCLRPKRLAPGEAKRRIVHLLDRVGLGEMAARYPGELSGGEQQRVAIARALVLQPEAVLLDEPLSDLDIGLRENLLHMFQELFRENETTAVYVTHDPWEAKRIASRVVIIEQGQAVFSGRLEELKQDHPSRFVQDILEAIGSRQHFRQ